jgi:hypothetical protein
MGRRGKRHARIASVSTPTRITVSVRLRARILRFCRQRRSRDAISGNVTAGLGDSSLARFPIGALYRSSDQAGSCGKVSSWCSLCKNSLLVIPKPALSARTLPAAGSETADSSRDNPAFRNDNPLEIFQTTPQPKGSLNSYTMSS